MIACRCRRFVIDRSYDKDLCRDATMPAGGAMAIPLNSALGGFVCDNPESNCRETCSMSTNRSAKASPFHNGAGWSRLFRL